MFLKKTKRGYLELYEWVNGKGKYVKYIGKDPSEYLASIEKGVEILAAIKEYPDLAICGTGQTILANYKKRKLVKQKTPQKTYRTIIIDPPWPMEKIVRKVVPITQQYDFEYATMSLEQITDLPIPELADKDGCQLYLWTTQKFLPPALKIMDAWGFPYILTMVWHKNGGFQPFNLPQYNCEFVLFGKSGNAPFLSTKRLFCCFNGKRREHSRKPDEFYDMIRRVSPEPRLDYFSREEKEGFDSYGAESSKFSG